MFAMSLPYLGSAALATIVAGLYQIPCGFLAAQARKVAGGKDETLGERLAWTAALAYPVSAMVSLLTGHFAGPRTTEAVVLGILFLAGVVALRTVRLAEWRGFMKTWRLWLVLLALTAWCFIATIPVLVSGRLEEGVFTNDWYIRIPLAFAAAAGDVPPKNPLFTLAGTNAPLHYYYFFIAQLAPPMRLAGYDGRSALIAGTVWAGISFFAVSWLMLRYLVIPEEAAHQHESSPMLHLQPQALIFVAVSLIAGLDLVPNLGALAMGGRLYPTLFFWNSDAISTWPGTLPFTPHHTVGLSAAACGYLLLVLNSRRSGNSAPTNQPLSLMTILLIGICFAAAMGTSTFIAVAVLLAAGAWAMDGLIHGSWRAAAMAASSIALAAIMDAPLLLDRSHHAAVATTAATAQTFPLKLLLRNWHQAYGITGELLTRLLHIVQPQGIRAYVGALPMLVGVYAVDLGFFWVVLWYRLRGRRTEASRQSTGTERALFWFFLSCASISFFVSSSPMQHGLNDLGRHTAMGARFVLMLWACPMVAEVWQRWRAGTLSLGNRTMYLLAASLAVVGWLGTAWDMGVQRVYLPLIDEGVIRGRVPFLAGANAGQHYEELRQAWAAVARATPQDAVVQDNPDGLLQRQFLLYLNRRVAAGDISCETAFGGDLASCRSQIVRPLLSIFEQTEGDAALRVPFDSSPEAFRSSCAALHVNAMFATDSDAVWAKADSWVWQGQALYAGRFVRVVACPATPITASR